MSGFEAWMSAFARLIDEHSTELTDLDRQIGDADHGTNMARGVHAIAQLAEADFPSPGAYLKKAGMTLVSTVGGASGPLYGTLLMKMGAALTDASSAEGILAALRAGVEGVQARGKASRGDKTMLDVLIPALEAAEGTEGSLADRIAAGLDAAREGAEATIPLVARKGRASYLGERSSGVMDPGAASSVFLWQAAAEVVGE